MRIALIHSFYTARSPSGENVIVNSQAEALANAGFAVRLIATFTDQRRRRELLYPIRAGLNVSIGSGVDPTTQLLEFQPDVVWVHNLFPNFSTKWIDKWQGPLIATLYNYRPVCANGVLLRDGKICTLCPDGQPLSALRYRCYKGSRIASIPLAIQITKGLTANPLISRADKIVVLSNDSRDVYERFGISRVKLVVLPAFGKTTRVRRNLPTRNNRWVVAARLSPEKGVRELVQEWPEEFELDVYGDGDDRAEIQALAGPNVRLMGQVPPRDLATYLPNYVGMIFPSLVWETQGLAVTEALEAGLSIVAKDTTGVAGTISRYQIGQVYGAKSQSLHSALNKARLMSVNQGKVSAIFPSEKSWLLSARDIFRSVMPSGD